MYRKVSLSSFHNGKVEYCTTSGSGDIEENASAIFFYSDFINGVFYWVYLIKLHDNDLL